MKKDNWYKFVDTVTNTFEYFKFDMPLSKDDIEALGIHIKSELNCGYCLYDAILSAIDTVLPYASFNWGSPFQYVIEI